MRISFNAIKQTPLTLVNLRNGLNNNNQLIFPPQNFKNKVVVILGATGTGKSRLSIHLANRFDAEIINSDKMQVYKGLDIVTNKITLEERLGVPHHLLDIIHPDENFTADDFVNHTSVVTEDITRRGKLAIIVGGSNLYIDALVNDDMTFRSKYDFCFLWVDVSMHVLFDQLWKRVEKMMDDGLVEEVQDFFDPKGDYTRGIRRSIGVAEMHEYFENLEIDCKEKLLERAKGKIVVNTCKLAYCQYQNILRLKEQLMWKIHQLDATEVLCKHDVDSDEAWKRLVAEPSIEIVGRFLCKDHKMNIMPFAELVG